MRFVLATITGVSYQPLPMTRAELERHKEQLAYWCEPGPLQRPGVKASLDRAENALVANTTQSLPFVAANVYRAQLYAGVITFDMFDSLRDGIFGARPMATRIDGLMFEHTMLGGTRLIGMSAELRSELMVEIQKRGFLFQRHDDPDSEWTIPGSRYNKSPFTADGRSDFSYVQRIDALRTALEKRGFTVAIGVIESQQLTDRQLFDTGVATASPRNGRAQEDALARAIKQRIQMLNRSPEVAPAQVGTAVVDELLRLEDNVNFALEKLAWSAANGYRREAWGPEHFRVGTGAHNSDYVIIQNIGGRQYPRVPVTEVGFAGIKIGARDETVPYANIIGRIRNGERTFQPDCPTARFDDLIAMVERGQHYNTLPLPTVALSSVGSETSQRLL